MNKREIKKIKTDLKKDRQLEVCFRMSAMEYKRLKEVLKRDKIFVGEFFAACARSYLRA